MENSSENKLFSELDRLQDAAARDIAAARNDAELKEAEVRYLGKKGAITEILKGLKEVPPESRKEAGQAANRTKETIAEALAARERELAEAILSSALEKEKEFDPTLPGDAAPTGSLHPITLVQSEIEDIFSRLGFMILDGPEMESDYYNFEALNIPRDHPARDMQDTFWLENGLLLRTHTSPCQIRGMEKHKPPFRAIAPGRVFRYEAIDASHENTFHQLEGLMIDRNISIANLIAMMNILLAELLRRDVKLRLRPGYFPFVEPGFELDVQCAICGGEGCPTCKRSGWVEILPCGMVHPNVLRAGGVDPAQWTGFAFGLGLTRLAMMKYGIKDIRAMNGCDLRALAQFKA